VRLDYRPVDRADPLKPTERRIIAIVGVGIGFGVLLLVGLTALTLRLLH
jgi:hypothetical protein